MAIMNNFLFENMTLWQTALLISIVAILCTLSARILKKKVENKRLRAIQRLEGQQFIDFFKY